MINYFVSYRAFHDLIIRIVSPTGNGAHVFIPREWTGEEVFVIRKIKQKKDIKSRIMTALEDYLEHIEGIYLYGSQAREDNDANSDIDLFVITNRKVSIKIKGYEIVALQKSEIDKAIKIAPTMIYLALAEAKPILNATLLYELKQKYKPQVTDFLEYIKETEGIIKVNEELLDPYSIILRLRGIFTINYLLSHKAYSKKAFLSWLKDNAKCANAKMVYDDYLNLKRDKNIKVRSKDEDIQPLLSLLKSETALLKEKIHVKKRKTS
jgi:predicted nucleotidyltransferase